MISVIVPIYNVEKYIEYCLDSIISQTYSDLEILLINDGSTDNSLKICESYQKKDRRIKFFNQSNKGQSAARNLGLDKMTGDFVMFVDSDDWIHPQTIEILFNNLQKSGLSMVIGGVCSIHNLDPHDVKFSKVSFDFMTYNTREALIYSYTKTGCAIWGRLYRKELFENLRFPVGRTSEDIAITVYIIEKCNFVALNSSKFYYYYSRPNSTCTSAFNIKKFDTFYVYKDLLEYVKCRHPFLVNIIRKNLTLTIISLFNKILATRLMEVYISNVREMRSYIRKNCFLLLFNPILEWKYKILLTVLLINVSFYRFFFIRN